MKPLATMKAKWSGDIPAFGAWAALPCAFGAELMCPPGIDYVCVDQQHGVIDYRDMVGMLRAIEGRGVAALTRVPANETWLISKSLDAGAAGVIVPMVSTRAEAEAAVAACRYPPSGVRSYGPIRSALVMEDRSTEVVGNQVLCFVMVETRDGVANIDAIASTPGLDGIYVGPADLALGLGLPPDLDKNEPEHAAAVAAILASCRRHGVIAGIQCGSGASARRYADMGFRLVTFTKDSAILASIVEKELGVARGDSAALAARGYT